MDKNKTNEAGKKYAFLLSLKSLEIKVLNNWKMKIGEKERKTAIKNIKIFLNESCIWKLSLSLSLK